MRGVQDMKKMTANFIIIMFSGLLLMGLLTKNMLRRGDTVAVFSDHVLIQEEDVTLVPAPMELVAPDHMDTDDLLRQITSGGAKTQDSGKNAGVTAPAETITTVTTTMTTTTTTTSSAAMTTTIAGDTDENGSYIINQNYESPYYIVVYTGSQSVGVYGKDADGEYTRLVKAFTCSTGRKDSSPTRKGMYKIRAKYRWRKLMGDCYGQYSSSISTSYLFHSVPYDRQDPSSLFNASYDNLGKAVSHGCIRMCVRDCKWVYDNCPIGTQVHVVWASGPKGDSVPQRIRGAKYSGWDPSDRWSKGNPYFADGDANKSSTTQSSTTASEKSATSSASSTSAATTTTAATTAAATTTTADSPGEGATETSRAA